MIFYTPDSYMIFGISRCPIAYYDTTNEEEYLDEMKTFADTDDGYITYECPPEDTFLEFANLVKQYNQSKYV